MSRYRAQVGGLTALRGSSPRRGVASDCRQVSDAEARDFYQLRVIDVAEKDVTHAEDGGDRTSPSSPDTGLSVVPCGVATLGSVVGQRLPAAGAVSGARRTMSTHDTTTETETAENRNGWFVTGLPACPACGNAIPEHEISGRSIECRGCRRCWGPEEVLL